MSADRDQPVTLTCSGLRKYHGIRCYSLARWAVKQRDGGQWHGACHQHVHQVLKRLEKADTDLIVLEAKEAMEEEGAFRRRLAVATQGEKLVEDARPIVQDTDTVWTGGYLAAMLAQEGHQLTADQGREVLELLCEENVVEHQGSGSYVCTGILPQ